jgi:hypothetical protein
MKCAHCGLPLSPTNTSKSCPRCHLSLSSGPTPIVQQQPQEQIGSQAWTGSAQAPIWGQAQYQSSPPSPLPPTWTSGPHQNQIPFPPVAQEPFQSAENMRQSAPAPGGMPSAITNNNTYIAPNRTPGVMYSTPTSAVRPQAPRTSNLGFIVAALCVITGGLILVSVFFFAMGLPSAGTTTAYPATPLATRNITATSAATPAPSPTAITSPTAGTFPGQQYIVNPQMASAVNINTAQPLILTTIFKVNQKIYVTFYINPGGKSGAVCLYWYLNNKSVTQFPFAVTANAKAGYSYAIYGGTGPAYVEIFWASTTSCSDKILAQHVTFTVTH